MSKPEEKANPPTESIENIEYKVGDIVKCWVETRSNKRKYVLSRYLDENYPKDKLETRECLIISAFLPYQGAKGKLYKVKIDEDLVGWRIGGFHILHENIDSKFNNCKFWEVSAEFICEKVSKVASKPQKPENNSQTIGTTKESNPDQKH